MNMQAVMETMDRRFGFIHDNLDIKILILFILARLPEPVGGETLAQLTMIDDGINYFDFAACLAELVRTGHATLEDNRYAITDKGRTNGQITESGLPYSVRVQAEKNAAEVALHMRRSALISVSHTLRSRGGCTVSLSMSDGVTDVFAMQLLAGSDQQAQQIEQRFQADAEKIYGDIMALLTQEK